MAIHYTENGQIKTIPAPEISGFDIQEQIDTPDWMAKPASGSVTHLDNVNSVDDTHRRVRVSVYALTRYIHRLLWDSATEISAPEGSGERDKAVAFMTRAVVEFILMEKSVRELPPALVWKQQPRDRRWTVINVSCAGAESETDADPLVSAWEHLARIEAVAASISPWYMRPLAEVGSLFAVADVGRGYLQTFRDQRQRQPQVFYDWRQRCRRVILWMVIRTGDWLTDYETDLTIGATARHELTEYFLEQSSVYNRLYPSANPDPILGEGELVVNTYTD